MVWLYLAVALTLVVGFLLGLGAGIWISRQ
jgi:hypothetical protein